MSIELHIITACVVIIAIDSLADHLHEVRNWFLRMKAHRQWEKGKQW